MLILGFVFRLRRDGIIGRERDNSFFLRFLSSGEALPSRELLEFIRREGFSLAERMAAAVELFIGKRGHGPGCSTEP